MNTLLDIFKSFKNKKTEAIIYRTGIRRFTYSYQEIYKMSLQFATYLHKQGITKGDRVLIWAPNSPWWVVSFWGIISTGAIVVPVDFISGRERAETIAHLTKAKLIIQSSYKLDKFKSKKAILIEDLQFLIKKEALSEVQSLKPSDIAEIVYTSGTTGNPKGVVLTHKNITTNLTQVSKHVPSKAEYNFLSVLPLSHMLELTVGMLVPFYNGASIIYLRTLKPSSLLNAFSQEKVYAIVLVPRLLQLLKTSIEREFESKGLKSILNIAINNSKSLPILAKKSIFLPVHKKFGFHFVAFLSGGAKLDKDLSLFWRNLGFRVVEGYGLTECSPILTSNTYFRTSKIKFCWNNSS
jgi:long-chain acyl-CoA synthetase